MDVVAVSVISGSQCWREISVHGLKRSAEGPEISLSFRPCHFTERPEARQNKALAKGSYVHGGRAEPRQYWHDPGSQTDPHLGAGAAPLFFDLHSKLQYGVCPSEGHRALLDGGCPVHSAHREL